MISAPKVTCQMGRRREEGAAGWEGEMGGKRQGDKWNILFSQIVSCPLTREKTCVREGLHSFLGQVRRTLNAQILFQGNYHSDAEKKEEMCREKRVKYVLQMKK